ncbi:MAG: hypothetical protein H6721_01665 [Sandaracinus sp.]|nr:hypothetical protein [Sandaracinus sp.]MCB9611223.1 hypothetical protein [Sandaracinus sp.]MCB9630850.1 hypothetical protein [Sandaracinus sp.]
MARAIVLACASFAWVSFVPACMSFPWASGALFTSTARAQDASEGALASAYGDGVAAIVGAPVPRADAIVLLHSDVDFRARLRLTRELGGQVPRGPVPPDLLRASLDELVGEALIAREARRVQVGIPGAAALREERRALESLAGGVEAFSALMVALGATEMEIAAMVERRAMVRLFLDANLRGGTQIEDAEVVALYESSEHPFLGQELDEVREPLRAILRRRRIENAVARWIEVLRGRTVVRMVAPYAS